MKPVVIYMSDKAISQMDFKELRSEVQYLRDELALFMRKYEDIIYNLDSDNFGTALTLEKDSMKTQIKLSAEAIQTKVSESDLTTELEKYSTITQTAEKIASAVSEVDEKLESYSTIEQTAAAISSKVSKTDLTTELASYSTITQTADAVRMAVAKGIDRGEATAVASKEAMTDTTKIYLLRTTDEDGKVTSEAYYYYNSVSKTWEEIENEDSIYTVFSQTTDGFSLKGNVLIDGNTVVTQNLKLSGNVTWDMSNSPVKSQYSVNGTDNWHDTYTSGDMYMHMSFDGGKTWSNATRVVGANGTNGRDGRDGSDANVTPQNVFNALTAGGEEQGIFAAFVNNENQLYINGAFIQADSLACTKLYAKGHLDGYHAKLAGNIGDFGVYNSLADSNANPTNANCIWGIYSGGDGAINFYSYGDNYGGYNSNAETYFAKGKWDFSNCDSIIWGENAPVARFG